MTKIIKLIFLTLIVFIQGYGIINKPLDSQNQLELTEKIKLLELSDRWALIVGVSNYKDTNIRDLNYADKDASSFYNSLIEKCRFKKEQIKILLNKDATYENIRKSISGWLFKNAQKNDKIIIFFSGHGYRDIDNNNNDEDDGFDEFLVPFDFQSDDISSAIRDDEFAYWINSLKAGNILLILDSCFSGGAAKAKGIINENISIKGDVKVDSFTKDIFGEVPREGVSLLGASKAEQISFEEPKLKMGIFTYFLIDSMDKKSDMNLDNKIAIRELFDNLKPKVLKYSKANYKREQEPILIDTMKNPFDLVYIPIELNGSAGKNSAKIENLISKANLAKDINRKIELLEECCMLDPQDEELHAKLALQLFWNENYDKAIYHYEIAISITSKKYPSERISNIHLLRYYESISEAYESKGAFEEAKQHIQKAIDAWRESGLNIGGSRFFNQLGDLYYKNNELSEAIQTYLYSIQMDEVQDEVYFNLSRIYTKQMKYEEALSILEKAININPDYSEFYYLQGVIIKYIENDIDRSDELFKRFFDLSKGLKLSIELISLTKEVDGKRSSEVILILEKTIKEYDYYAEVYIDLIQICNKKNKNLEKAKYYYNKLIEIYPFFKKEKNLFLKKN